MNRGHCVATLRWIAGRYEHEWHSTSQQWHVSTRCLVPCTPAEARGARAAPPAGCGQRDPDAASRAAGAAPPGSAAQMGSEHPLRRLSCMLKPWLDKEPLVLICVVDRGSCAIVIRFSCSQCRACNVVLRAARGRSDQPQSAGTWTAAPFAAAAHRRRAG